MRSTFIAGLGLCLALGVGCGASSDRGVREVPNEVEAKPAPAVEPDREVEPVDDVEEYFGDPVLEGDERVDPVDVIEPRSDLFGTEPSDLPEIDPEHRARPAEIGDPRLEAEPPSEESIGKPDAIE